MTTQVLLPVSGQVRLEANGDGSWHVIGSQAWTSTEQLLVPDGSEPIPASTLAGPSLAAIAAGATQFLGDAVAARAALKPNVRVVFGAGETWEVVRYSRHGTWYLEWIGKGSPRGPLSRSISAKTGRRLLKSSEVVGVIRKLRLDYRSGLAGGKQIDNQMEAS